MAYVLCFILGALAWLFSTVAAGGATMIALPILGFGLGVDVAVPAVAVAALMANPSRAFIFWRAIHWRLARVMIAGTVIGALAGAISFVSMPRFYVEIGIGLFLMSTVLQFRHTHQSFKVYLWQFMPLSLFVGFLSAIMGGTGPVLNPFLLNYGLTKSELVATKAINSLVLHSIKVVAYGALGVLAGASWHLGLALGAGAIIGTFAAKYALLKISQDTFKKLTVLAMFIAGLLMLRSGILHFLTS